MKKIIKSYNKLNNSDEMKNRNYLHQFADLYSDYSKNIKPMVMNTVERHHCEIGNGMCNIPKEVISDDTFYNKFTQEKTRDKFRQKISALNHHEIISFELPKCGGALAVIHIYTSGKKRASQKMITRIIETIALFSYAISLFSPDRARNVILYLFPIAMPKRFSGPHGERLVTDNVNSAYTMSHSDAERDYIVIYRKEELLKVLIHELIHLHSFHNTWFNKNRELSTREIFKIQPLKSNDDKDEGKGNSGSSSSYPYRLSEAYVEALATVFGALYQFTLSGKRKISFKRLIAPQIDQACMQSAKILLDQDIDDVNILTMDSTFAIRENTNTVAYHLFKAVILADLDRFRDNVLDGGIFMKDDKKLDAFIIESFHNNKQLQKNIDKYISTMKNKRISGSSFKMTTLVDY